MGTENRKSVVVLGAGPAGLGAANYLSKKGYRVSVIERADYVGGASASFRIKDYIVDYGPHAFHVKNKDIVNMVTGLIGDDYNKVRRNSRLILDGKNLKYPLDIKEAIFSISPILSTRILFDYFKARIKSALSKNNGYNTFQDWGQGAFGDTLYRLAFGNYSERMWGLPGNQLSYKLAQQKLLKLNLMKIILKVLGFGDATFEGGVTEYYDLYPRFGIGTVFEKMRDELLNDSSNSLYLNSKIISIDSKESKLQSITFEYAGVKKEAEFDYLVSTIPLRYLGEYLAIPESRKLSDIAGRFKYRDIRIIYVVLDKDYFSDIHWIYLLDYHFRFNRVSEQKNLNKESSPPGKTVISLDISCNLGDEIWDMPDKDFLDLALRDLSHLGIERGHVVDYFSLKLRDVYPVYYLNFDSDLQEFTEIIQRYTNIYITGRQGLYLNNDIHDSIEMGKFCSEFISAGKDSSQWYDFIYGYIRKSLEGGNTNK